MSANTLVACHPLRSMQHKANTLSFDIGGTGVKASVVDPKGSLMVERVRIDTPVGSHPDEFVAAMAAMVAQLPAFEQISVGFPGMVRGGVVLTAANLKHEAWTGYPLAQKIEALLHCPTRLANDADMQGLAVIAGKGLEMVVTLGTGFGSALFENGKLCPHLELAHAPFRKGGTYNEQLGEDARQTVGTKKWRKRVAKMIENMRTLTHFDHLYIGGGNQRHLGEALPEDISRVDNVAGISGGAFLWRD
ncbi:hypothetical protein LBMAG49_19250 [Planctomycetota bacterium]|nr:ROK family protein [Planctomycetota bacterium]GDY02596.1 hypothetical protein LBMAG49_19250 [Planctomycetota bacterium]